MRLTLIAALLSLSVALIIIVRMLVQAHNARKIKLTRKDNGKSAVISRHPTPAEAGKLLELHK